MLKTPRRKEQAEAQERAEKELARSKLRKLHLTKAIMDGSANAAEGREFLHLYCGVDGTLALETFTGSSQTYYNEGVVASRRKLLADCKAADFKLWVKMEEEAEARRVEESFRKTKKENNNG